MQQLFETNINRAADALPGNVDAEIIITSAPYILYEQFKLDDNFRTYLEGVMLSEYVLRWGSNLHCIKNPSNWLSVFNIG